jgi:ketosteroid isomerase-like protein
MSNAERLGDAMARVLPGDDFEMSEGILERIIEALAPIAADDFVTLMTGPDNTFESTEIGTDGLRKIWTDWLDVFESVRFQIEGIEEVGENVLMVGNQVGVTRHGGVEMAQPSAVVWKFRDGEIVRVEFHLERERASTSARERP